MSKPKLIFGRVTERQIVRKKTVITIEGLYRVVTNSGSLHDRSITVSNKQQYFITFTPGSSSIYDGEILDVNDYCSATSKNKIDAARKNLTAATLKLASNYQSLSKQQRAVVLRFAGVLFTGFGSGASAFNAFTAAFAWEPHVAVTSAAISAILAVVAAVQYEDLCDAQKTAVKTTKAFNNALKQYHVTLHRYAPESMQDVDVADPIFRLLSAKLYSVLPEFKELCFETNRPNWSFV